MSKEKISLEVPILILQSARGLAENDLSLSGLDEARSPERIRAIEEVWKACNEAIKILEEAKSG